jgi:hypothetical protein
MKKIATVFALWLLALMSIKDGFGQQSDVTVIENEATVQIRSALENASIPLTKENAPKSRWCRQNTNHTPYTDSPTSDFA